MIIFIHYLVHITLISWALSLHQSIFPSSISLIICSLVDFGGSPHSGATTNRCLGPLYFFRWYFVITLIGLIHFGAQLYIFTVNLHFRVIRFGYQFRFWGYLFHRVFPGITNTPSLYYFNVSIRQGNIYWVRHYIMWGRMMFWNNPQDDLFLVSKICWNDLVWDSLLPSKNTCQFLIIVYFCSYCSLPWLMTSCQFQLGLMILDLPFTSTFFVSTHPFVSS